jgi:Carboxypeptidase regulatory-like domain
VAIAVTNLNTGTVQNTTTNAQGLYSIPFLTPGTYSVRATANGFATRTLTNITLETGSTARAGLALGIGKVETTLEVKASAAVLNTETTTVGYLIDQEQVSELPLNDRNYLELAMLAPGTSPSDGGKPVEPSQHYA